LYPVSEIWTKRRFLAVFVFLGIKNLKGQTSQSDSATITQDDKKKSVCHLKKDTSDEVLKNENEEDTEKEWLLNTGYVLSQKEELLLI
jgi:hypothetical protein|tara:strand:+ start:4381 stop:4644 length:264 start_codon:yes stop_codon:yes gene_type:complete